MSESKKAKQLSDMNKQVETYNDMPFDRVESLEYIGVEKVYDLTEPLLIRLLQMVSLFTL